jgi:hypothetical protein
MGARLMYLKKPTATPYLRMLENSNTASAHEIPLGRY